MAAHFFDASAVVKRYVNEAGSAWVRSTADPRAGNRIYLAHITVVEVTAALARRRRGGSLSAANTSTLLAQFAQDLQGAYQVIEITPAMIVAAASLADQYELRGYDAVQLATAIGLQAHRSSAGLDPMILVSADRELNAAAIASGLAVEDLNLHP
jgi:predicted nucleic acid-binding protein